MHIERGAELMTDADVDDSTWAGFDAIRESAAKVDTAHIEYGQLFTIVVCYIKNYLAMSLSLFRGLGTMQWMALSRGLQHATPYQRGTSSSHL